MRILHVIAEFSSHEAMGRTVTEIARRVPAEHYVVTTRAHDGQEAFAGVIELDGAVETFPIGRTAALDAAIADVAPDLIHVHGGALAPIMLVNTAVATVPNVMTMYAWPVVPSPRRLRAGGLRAAMQSNVLRPRVLATSVLPAAVVKRALRRLGTRAVMTPDPRVEQKIGALRVGSGAPHDGRRAQFRSEAPVVLFAGRAESVRGIDTLLECFPDVLREVPDARLRLLLIPRPELDGLLEKARAAGLGDHLEVVTDPVTDLLGEMADAQVGTWPFKYDYTTSPPAMAAAEALSVGLPTVATEVSCVEAVIEDGVNGTLVPVGQPQALAAAIVRLLKDRVAWDRYAEAGPRTMTQRLSWERMASTVGQVYGRTLGVDIVPPERAAG
jgi:glycosyltransferase involved in cell wall biosynthesis